MSPKVVILGAMCRMNLVPITQLAKVRFLSITRDEKLLKNL